MWLRGCNRGEIFYLTYPSGDFLLDVVLDKSRGSNHRPKMPSPFHGNGYVSSLENGCSLFQTAFFYYKPGLACVGIVAVVWAYLISVKRSHHVLSEVRVPPDVASSANHTCSLPSPSRRWMRGVIAMAYIAMAKGSPWVVPSWESMVSASMNSWTSSR